MYNRRLKVFIAFCVLLLLICLARLAQMQLLSQSYYRNCIADLQKNTSRQLKTVRGRILDRYGRVLALDVPRFQLCIDYKLARLLDNRFWLVKILRRLRRTSNATKNVYESGRPNQEDKRRILSDLRNKYKAELEDLHNIIHKCAQFEGVKPVDIEERIQKTINDRLWNLRTYLAWKRNYPNQEFAQAVPDANERLLLASSVNIAEMHKTWPLLELKSDDDILAAQLEFMDTNGIEVLPQSSRMYQYGSVAAQTIGWVGPATEEYRLPLSGELLRYLPREVCGRSGIEYVCEAILRGKRGKIVYNYDAEFLSRTERKFGADVTLTLDIELQQRIEKYLTDCDYNPKNCNKPTAVVVIDVESGDILALVSMPVFDLNHIRSDYSKIEADANKPLLNRAINQWYPPGSVIKPLILIAGLEEGKISADEVISCPAKKAPKGWPSCWLYNKYKWRCHDDMWANNARNAIKGSCNIYFSRLADRIDSNSLQNWLLKFGYGKEILLSPVPGRNLRQLAGVISSLAPRRSSPRSGAANDGRGDMRHDIKAGEKRYFGIGQGNLRVTPLQVANAMAVIARNGLYREPCLIRRSSLVTRHSNHELQTTNLGISPETIAVVRDGMSAVVNEDGGTAYKEFRHSGFAEQDVTVYGKTGSTENPDHAWFGGFAEDSEARSIAIAVVVEGGQHGSSDAAPLARDIIQFCIDAGYIGTENSDRD